MSRAAPGGEPVVLDVAQLEALLAGTFGIGLDAGRGREPAALVRLRLAKALLGAAEAHAVAAESLAIERGVSTGQMGQAESLALHAAACTGMPGPVFHLTARAVGVVTGLTVLEPGPRAPRSDAVLGAALQAATGLQQLLQFHGDCATAAGPQRAACTLQSAAAGLSNAAAAAGSIIELARLPAAARRTATTGRHRPPPRTPGGTVAASLAELEMRIKALESRAGRHDEDLDALIDTGSKTLTLVTALAEHAGLDPGRLLTAADEDS